MKKVFVLAVIGAACSSVAFAGEVRQTKAPTPVVKTTIMSDAQMDKVTAGDAGGQDMGQGHAYGFGNDVTKGMPAWNFNNSSHAGPK